jgi:phospholipase C
VRQLIFSVAFNTREENMSPGILHRNRWPRRAAVATVFGAVMACGLAAADDRADKDDAHRVKTDTPIKHLIVFIGENRTFDHIYATYKPKHGQSVANLLSKGIIFSTGIPGPHYILSQQFQIKQPYPSTYFIDALPPTTKGKTLYQQSPLTPTFPVPNTGSVPPRAERARPGSSAVRPNSRAGLGAADNRAVA